MPPLLGCVADDITGATDLALTLARHGMRTVQINGVPKAALPDADAIVVALKTRTAPTRDAVSQSLAAAKVLKDAGAQQLMFKYCSTFDSTDDGNIGPVAEAMLDFVGETFTVACPSFPANGRTVYQGHIFVGPKLISESSMRDHPLTPMRDPNLIRVMERQCRATSKVGLVPFPVVEKGPDAIRAAFDELRKEGKRFAIVDALNDSHLFHVGHACAGLGLLTGGSGVAMGLPGNFRRMRLLTDRPGREPMPHIEGGAVILSGSCSAATNRQVREAEQHYPSLRLDPVSLVRGSQSPRKILAWARENVAKGPVMIYATADPIEVTAAQSQVGREAAAEAVERCLADTARGLKESGVRKFIVAGGETSGAVAEALGAEILRIGPEIDAGVPWTIAVGDPRLYLAFKSGNFGADDLFSRALEMLP